MQQDRDLSLAFPAIQPGRTRVGFIGLGNQGAPIAERISRAGLELVVWARSQHTLDDFSRDGVTVADTPGALAEQSDVVCLCVLDDAVGEMVGEGVLANRFFLPTDDQVADEMLRRAADVDGFLASQLDAILKSNLADQKAPLTI